MIILNYNNKKYIEITEDKIIFYRSLGKRSFKRNKIKAAYMNNNYEIYFLYGNSNRIINVSNVKKRGGGFIRKAH